MNVSFSTRGWQDIPWEDQIRMAQTMRFGGVELYNVQNTPALTDRGGPLHKYNAAATARELWQAGLRIPCFDTSCDISGTDCTETVQTLLQTAHDVQSPYVAVTALHIAYGKGGVTLISFDAVRTALTYCKEGKIDLCAECNPLHGPRVCAIIEQLERGEAPEKLSYISEQLFTATQITDALLDIRMY